MKPQAVVQAGDLPALIIEAPAVLDQADVHQERIRQVGQQRMVQAPPVRYRAGGLHPGLQQRLPRRRVAPVNGRHQPDIEILAGGDHKTLIEAARLQLQLALTGQGFRRWHQRHLRLVVISLGGLLEGHGRHQDGFAALQRNHPARTETGAIPRPFHFEQDGCRDIAGAQEIRVLGVDDTVVRHRRHRGADRLGQYLPTVDPQAQGVHIGADKTVLAFGPGADDIDQLGEHGFRRGSPTSRHYPDL